MLKLIRILIFVGSLLLMILQWKNNTVGIIDKILMLGYLYCIGSFCLLLTIIFEMLYEKKQKNRSN
ncbi:hypothetical protein COK26_12305 [Bacillus thuringiensis]|nr:hypothetical protein COK26_12305 [Bacillus thuringiensis]PGP84278.1 hypothetical protein COA12_17985 [Bacillus thuringiensis]